MQPPPHYRAFRLVLVIVLGALAVAVGVWFAADFPYLIRELGGPRL